VRSVAIRIVFALPGPQPWGRDHSSGKASTVRYCLEYSSGKSQLVTLFVAIMGLSTNSAIAALIDVDKVAGAVRADVIHCKYVCQREFGLVSARWRRRTETPHGAPLWGAMWQGPLGR
jgi:hypothetical protein